MFTSLATIKGNIFTRYPPKNNVHKDIKDLLTVITTLRTDVNGSETIFEWNDYEWHRKR